MMKLEEIDEISAYPTGRSCKTTITKPMLNRLGFHDRKKHRLVVYGVPEAEGLVLLVDKRKVPRTKDYLDAKLGPIDKLEFSVPKEFLKKILK
jgi:hypothetical protein